MVISSAETFYPQLFCASAPTSQMVRSKITHNIQDASFADKWQVVAQPASEHTEKDFSDYLVCAGRDRRVLNCAIPLTRAHELTGFSLPEGTSASDCLIASVKGIFPDSLRNWKYQPIIRAVPQLPQLKPLPSARRNLAGLPWFDSPGQSRWLGINARHLRYHHQLWQDLHPKTLQGVNTTLVLALPQIAFSLTPHIQLEKTFLFLASLARGLGPVQLFPARYLYPDATLGTLDDSPAPCFADILPVTGGFAYPVVDCEPDPWRVLARFGKHNRYYGYPFTEARDSETDFKITNFEGGAMLLPNGKRVSARYTESRVFATYDRELNKYLLLNRDAFARATGFLRGTVTHDGLPFNLPVELQPLIYAVILTHWRLELDRPGDLTSYSVHTKHAAIRGYNYSQRVQPYYDNFTHLIHDISRDPNFCTYPLSTHLTQSWLGGNLQISNQLSASERDLNPNVMRTYYHQQLCWQMGVVSLMNHVGFRSRRNGAIRVSRTGLEIEKDLDFDGLAFHQMHRLLRFGSHLFPRATRPISPWPDLHPGFSELDRNLLTESLPKI